MEYCKKLYKVLFNGIIDAIKEMDSNNYGLAKEKLINIQQKAENIYINVKE